MIRRATSADANAIAAVWNAYIRFTTVTFNSVEKSPDDVAAMIRERDALGHGTFVAEDTGLLGFASYAQFRGGGGYATCMEHSVLLAPEARGRGVGRGLIQAVCDHARAAGAHQMIAGVSAENLDGVAFHARMGFAEIARVREAGRKFDRFIDLVLMQKFL
ncbi:MAG: N-acetyltransferase family protein [Tabrizicola sp.]|jgi:phosphinothricin acetyltransferase|nr:N-acetyltransferase family protein [Tabrizicola sp.]